jgi:hypothetical protein
MRIFLNCRSLLPLLAFMNDPLLATAPTDAPSEVALQPDFHGQFESNDISSSGRWVLEFKFENGKWSGRAKLSSGTWALLDGVKVNGNAIEFYIKTEPVTKFRAKIDSKNKLITGNQEIGDGRKNKFNNVFLPFTATRI